MITKEWANYLIKLNYQNIPEEVIAKSKLCFLDFLGVTLRGSKTKSGKIIRNVLKANNSLDDNLDASVIGGGHSSTLGASLANGVSAHALDLDDGHRLAQLHPGTCVIPAALSLAEASNLKGKEFLCSLVGGYQIAILMGMMINPQHRNRGYHSTGTCGTIGAAAAAVKALKLDQKEGISALGLAGTQAAGLLESDHGGSMGKHLHAGHAAHSGVLSALLAMNGFKGVSSILEGKEGFLSVMGGLKDGEMENDQLNNFINQKRPSIEKNHIIDVYFKKYPVCRHLHSAIDALIQILNENVIITSNIEEIKVETYKVAAEHANYNPQTQEALKQSLPAILALIIAKKDLNLANLKLDGYDKTTADKIQIRVHAELESLYPQKRPAQITLKTNTHLYRQRIDLAKGEPENPLNEDELWEKFAHLNPDFNLDLLNILDDLESYRMKDFMAQIL